ncbi:glycosyltransferase [Flavobacterium rhamnosiphilum]|uniref:Glycosyltransferase n=1 Tax=Flavobacterium rhamnosiphilum TaxID=2541724 RepID=A0A4R5F2X0_9FLAO|nr:glycosyltransferase family 4 protein [Flavobacterium rhamnosiphilum]TDE41743.1 glycosyltransferase [Flavobacterium rhamnosiphilum]
MKVVWIHSFDRQANKNAGVFMFQLMDALKSRGIVIDELYTGKITPFNLIPNVLRFRKVTKEYDIIHAQYGSGCGLLTAFLKGFKILTLRGSDWYVSKKSDSVSSYVHTRLAVLMTKLSLCKYNRIITMSDKMASEIRQSFPNLKIEIDSVMDGIDLNKFSPKIRKEERNKIDKFDDNSPWILFSSVAEKNPLKRFDLAQKAFLLAQKEMPNLQLKFMNGVSHENVPDFIACCDVILLTSTHEGWPNIIKEGLALNIPFVSTDVSDLKNISQSEESCTVVEENKNEEIMASELSQGIIKAIRIKDNNLLDFSKLTLPMSMDGIVNQIITIYESKEYIK